VKITYEDEVHDASFTMKRYFSTLPNSRDSVTLSTNPDANNLLERDTGFNDTASITFETAAGSGDFKSGGDWLALVEQDWLKSVDARSYEGHAMHIDMSDTTYQASDVSTGYGLQNLAATEEGAIIRGTIAGFDPAKSYSAVLRDYSGNETIVRLDSAEFDISVTDLAIGFYDVEIVAADAPGAEGTLLMKTNVRVPGPVIQKGWTEALWGPDVNSLSFSEVINNLIEITPIADRPALMAYLNTLTVRLRDLDGNWVELPGVDGSLSTEIPFSRNAGEWSTTYDPKYDGRYEVFLFSADDVVEAFRIKNPPIITRAGGGSPPTNEEIEPADKTDEEALAVDDSVETAVAEEAFAPATEDAPSEEVVETLADADETTDDVSQLQNSIIQIQSAPLPAPEPEPADINPEGTSDTKALQDSLKALPLLEQEQEIPDINNDGLYPKDFVEAAPGDDTTTATATTAPDSEPIVIAEAPLEADKYLNS